MCRTSGEFHDVLLGHRPSTASATGVTICFVRQFRSTMPMFGPSHGVHARIINQCVELGLRQVTCQ